MPPPFMLLHPQIDPDLPRKMPDAPGYTPPPLSIVNVNAQRSLNPDYIYLRNPAFPIINRPPLLTRAGIKLPTLISTTVGAPPDTTLFQEPADTTKIHYLPKYAIATHGTSMQRSVTFVPGSGNFILTVQLKDVTDPGIAATATPIVPGIVRYMLTANVQGQAKSWDFAQIASADPTCIALAFTVPDSDSRNVVYHAMTDPTSQTQIVIRRSLAVGSPVNAAAMVWQQSVVAIDSTIAFEFDPSLDAAVFSGLSNLGDGESAWKVYDLTWEGRDYPYYQNSTELSQIYFLPDSFKIYRSLTAPRAPSILVTTNGSDPASMSFGLTFQAKPVWDSNRITDALAKLQASQGLLSPSAPALFEATSTSLALSLPNADPSQGPVLTPQPNATIDIQAGVKCSLALSMPQFQQIYGALFETVSQLLSGDVTVTVGTDVRKIPLISSASDFAGDVFAVASLYDPLANVFTVTVSNAIESPIHVDSLPISLVRAGAPIAVATQTIAPALPFTVAPAATGAASGTNAFTVTMDLAAGTTIDATCAAQIDYSHSDVMPDPEAIWEAIMSNQVVAPVKRDIAIKVFASMFAPTAVPVVATGGTIAARPVLEAVQIVFENGQTVDFDATTPVTNGVMTIDFPLEVPLKAYVLQTGDTSTYRYRVDYITDPASPAIPADRIVWQTSNQSSFYVQSAS